MPRALSVNDTTVLKLAIFAVLEGYTETTPAEMIIMDAGIPTPPWPTDEAMDTINRLRVDGQPVVRTHRRTANGTTRYEFDYPIEETHLAGEVQSVCQALVVRLRQLLRFPPLPDEEMPKETEPAAVYRLAATIEILERPKTVH
ncbi:MAG: hypothetical protein OXF98_00935 [Rhodospirillaceae bacterium]|nr:hypothetical protein [Rhodospirillaceae bacterium]